LLQSICMVAGNRIDWIAN